MQIYLVGGAVRDALLGRPVTDRDWVVVGATPAQMLAEGYAPVGKDFPVFLHPKTKEEYALARTERKTGVGYAGFACDASPEVTLEADLLRRDLTINAMAQDKSGQIIDPYNGQQDLKDKILRHVSEAFNEDPLRVFRVARFAARYHELGFTIAEETLARMSTMTAAEELSAISPHRIWQETRRSVLESSPQVYFTTLQATGALNFWFKEMSDKTDFAALACAAELQKALVERWASLFHNHPVDEVTSLCERIHVPNAELALAQMAASHTSSLLNEQLSTEQLLAVFQNCDAWRREERFIALLNCIDAIALANEQQSRWQSQRQNIEAALTQAKAIDVKAIIATGVKGPEIKTALNSARKEKIAAFFK